MTQTPCETSKLGQVEMLKSPWGKHYEKNITKKQVASNKLSWLLKIQKSKTQTLVWKSYIKVIEAQPNWLSFFLDRESNLREAWALY